MIKLFVFIFSFLCTGKAESAGKLQVTPPVVAVRFGDSLSANCNTSESQIFGMGWESPYGGTGLVKDVSSVPFKLDEVQVWKINPLCYITLSNDEQVTEKLEVIIYKMPDVVSLSLPESKMVEGKQYSLKCDIVKVAPVKRLSVVWYKGKERFFTETFDSQNDPVDRSSFVNVTAHRDDDGTEIWCEAVLNLEPAAQTSPTMRSDSLGMNVLYPPTFSHPENETLNIPPGGPIAINCTTSANPPPVYSWHSLNDAQSTNQKENGSIFTPSSPRSGIYSCTVSNKLGSSTKYFTVIEEKWSRTTFGAILGVFLFLGVLLVIAGILFVKSNGSFSCNKGSYSRGNPSPSGPL